MSQKRLFFLDPLHGVLGAKSNIPLFTLLRERIRNYGVDEFKADLYVLFDFIFPKLSKVPGRPIIGMLGCGNLRFLERTNEPIGWMVQEYGIFGQWGRGWVDDPRREGTNTFTTEKSSRRIEGETSVVKAWA